MTENRVEISAYDNIEEFFKSDALLVTMGKYGKPNVMALGWKTIGELWHYSVLTVAVAPSRYSFELLTKGVREFTVNIPSNKISHAMDIAGSYSGRDTDKFKEAGIETIPGKRVKVPTIKDSMLSYECKIIHETDSGSNASHHLFVGEILASYAFKD